MHAVQRKTCGSKRKVQSTHAADAWSSSRLLVSYAEFACWHTGFACLLVVAAAYRAALQVADATDGPNQLLAWLRLAQGWQGRDGAQLGVRAAPCRAATPGSTTSTT
jgi:hypothetical protein